MRANTVADKPSLSRVKMRDEINCRKCQVLKEILGHILSQCASTKKEKITKHEETFEHILSPCASTKKKRIVRHDEVKDFILQRIAENDKETV
jgi:hypothetical protein